MQKTFDYGDIRRQVLDFLGKLGIEPYDEADIILDGKLHRFRLRDDKQGEKSGAITIYTDGWPAGFVMDWRRGIKENWKYDISSLDDEQQKYFNSEEYRKKCEEQERRAREKREAEQRKYAEGARRMWNRLPEAPKNHPYLQRKSLIWINNTALRYNPDTKSLAVPLTNIYDMTFSIQWIPEEGHKTFFTGTTLKGLFWKIWIESIQQNPKGTILLGEGFATMLKVFELTSLPCVAAMSCYRLEEVAKILREKFPEAKIIITADNDHQTERKTGKNPGMTYAQNVCTSKKFGKSLADGLVYPNFKPDEDGSDWDDFAILHGNEYAAAILKDDIARALMPKDIQLMLEKKQAAIHQRSDTQEQNFSARQMGCSGHDTFGAIHSRRRTKNRQVYHGVTARARRCYRRGCLRQNAGSAGRCSVSRSRRQRTKTARTHCRLK